MKTYRQGFTYYFMVPLLLLAGVWAVYYLVFKSPSREDINTTTIRSKAEKERGRLKPKILVRRPEISHLVDGKVTWKVYANEIDSDTSSGLTKLRNSNGVFFRNVEDKKSRFEFEAPLTVYNPKDKTVTAKGKITGKLLPEKYTLEASGLDWDEKNGSLNAGEIELQGGNSRIKGKMLTIRPDAKTVSITGGVVAEFDVGRKAGRKLLKGK